jgi:hypothetical protein
METIRQIVQVKRDPSELGKASRKLELTLPETVEPGLVEIIVVMQTLKSESQSSKAEQLTKSFGFLPKRVDPIEFQNQLRDEWNR